VKALTLTQPWASLVVLGVKRVETRSWRPRIIAETRIAVHAAKGWTAYDRELAADLHLRGVLPVPPDSLPRGAVIGEVTVTGCQPTQEAVWKLAALEFELGDYSSLRWAWHLRDPAAYPEPVPARGSLGLWEWEPAP